MTTHLHKESPEPSSNNGEAILALKLAFKDCNPYPGSTPIFFFEKDKAD